ncbi:FecR family protein [Bacteroides pyogenes]|uniref:FecR family protein n=1 Tax=Bacteroides pyogenes TaxID=310300 RepID=UPI001F3572AD|nr:FecR family protein [Bacteroides pyogenes]MCE9108012.1 FecR family protein [Bacteroides pyogenes]
MNRKEDKLEQAVRSMEEGKQLSDEELSLLAGDKELIRACRELQSCKNALMRRYDSNAPDVEKEWETFRFRKHRIRPSATRPAPFPNQSSARTSSGKKKSYRFLWGTLTGMAASFLILLLYTWLSGISASRHGIVTFEAIDSVQQVMLQTSTGERIPLARETHEEMLKTIGTSLIKKDTLELNYRNRNSPEVPQEDIERHCLFTPRGKDFKITLADGTVVWINAESCLEYPLQFAGKNRIVHLEGEAYFKVARNNECPFIIRTDRMQIQVLGTELNVRNYTSHDSHVTLVSGQVKVSDSKNRDNAVCLKPGEDAQWREHETFVVKTVDTDIYTYWKDGYFYFDNAPLVDVTRELGRWYNINVVFENKDLMNMHVRYFCVRNQTLERAISLLNRMKKIHATLNGNTVYIR